VAASTLLALNYIVGAISGKNRRFRKFIEGQPTLLVHDGEIIHEHMVKERVSKDELDRALREHGISSTKDVALAVLEVDGTISCLKYDDLNPESTNPTMRKRFLQKHQ
jgi:uncharacterized membrane protein YcaP (DUF421 family)